MNDKEMALEGLKYGCIVLSKESELAKDKQFVL